MAKSSKAGELVKIIANEARKNPDSIIHTLDNSVESIRSGIKNVRRSFSDEPFDSRFLKNQHKARKGELENMENMDVTYTSDRIGEEPQGSITDLEGKEILFSMTDNSNAGQRILDINGVPIDVDLEGGFKHMFDTLTPELWAAQLDKLINKSGSGFVDVARQSKAKTGEDPFMAVFQMAPSSSDQTMMMMQTMHNHAKNNMSPDDYADLVEELGNKIISFKGAESKDVSDAAMKKIAGEKRTLLTKIFDKYRDKGGLSIGQARLAVADKKQLNPMEGQIIGAGQIDADAPIIEKSGHSTYEAGIGGTGKQFAVKEKGITPFHIMSPEQIKAHRPGIDLNNITNDDVRALTINHGLRKAILTEDRLKELEKAGLIGDKKQSGMSERELLNWITAAGIFGTTVASATYSPPAEAGKVEKLLGFGKQLAKGVFETDPQKVTKASKAGFTDKDKDALRIKKEYQQQEGLSTNASPRINKLDAVRSREIADAFDEMPHAPNDPEVLESYNALANEAQAQYKMLLDNGVEFEYMRGQGEPYKNSKEVMADIKDNKRLKVLATEGNFGQEAITAEELAENPMLQVTEFLDANGKPLLVNDVFRAVHDYFGHATTGTGFGAVGEEGAWEAHSRMFSPLARRALTTETRGQNSWVNYGKQLRREDGSIPQKGDADYVKPQDRSFADQKIGLLPEKFSSSDYNTVWNNPKNRAAAGSAAIAAAPIAYNEMDKKAPQYQDRIDNPQNYPFIQNEDGSRSSHKMAAEIDENGDWIGFPMIVQMPNNELHEFTNKGQAMEYNKSIGNFTNFGNDEKTALAYGEGSWKTERFLEGKPKSKLKESYNQTMENINNRSPEDALEFDEQASHERQQEMLEAAFPQIIEDVGKAEKVNKYLQLRVARGGADAEKAQQLIPELQNMFDFKLDGVVEEVERVNNASGGTWLSKHPSLEALVIGTGRGMNNFVNLADQGYMNLTGDEEGLAELEARQAREAEMFDPQEGYGTVLADDGFSTVGDRNPLASQGGEMLGEILMTLPAGSAGGLAASKVASKFMPRMLAGSTGATALASTVGNIGAGASAGAHYGALEDEAAEDALYGGVGAAVGDVLLRQLAKPARQAWGKKDEIAEFLLKELNYD